MKDYQFASHPLWLTFQSWWNPLSRREKHLTLGGIVMLLIASLHWGVYQPLKNQYQQSKHNAIAEKQLLTWVSQKANDIVRLRGLDGGNRASTQPLNQIITSSLARFKIELIRVQPNDAALQVWIKPIPFNQLVQWLAYLQEAYAIEVESIEINRTNPNGMVEIERLQLKKAIN